MIDQAGGLSNCGEGRLQAVCARRGGRSNDAAGMVGEAGLGRQWSVSAEMVIPLVNGVGACDNVTSWRSPESK
jgi:hypothetical protein